MFEQPRQFSEETIARKVVEINRTSAERGFIYLYY